MTTKSYVVAEVEDAGNAACTCQNCDAALTADQVTDIGDCALTPGDASPVGRCPKCDGLVYLDQPLRGEVVDIVETDRRAQHLVEDMQMGFDGSVEFDDDSWEASLDMAKALKRDIEKLKNGAHVIDSDYILVSVVEKDLAGNDETFPVRLGADAVSDIITCAVQLSNAIKANVSAVELEQLSANLTQALASRGLVDEQVL